MRASHLIRCFPVRRSFYELRHVWVTFSSKSGILPPTTATPWSTKACQNPKVSFEHPRGLKTWICLQDSWSKAPTAHALPLSEGRCISPPWCHRLQQFALAKKFLCYLSVKMEKFGFRHWKCLLGYQCIVHHQYLISMSWWWSITEKQVCSPWMFQLMKILSKAIINSYDFDFINSITSSEFHFLLLILITAFLHFFKA